MKTIKFINSRKWDNKQSFFNYNFGLLSIGIRGLVLDIIIERRKFKEHCKRIEKMGISKDGSTFPFKYNDIF